jgi:hypothetical protein
MGRHVCDGHHIGVAVRRYGYGAQDIVFPAISSAAARLPLGM